VPINPHTGKEADTTRPGTWGSFSRACEAVDKYGNAGVGFVFTREDPYCGVDLDNCVDDGGVAPWAMEIVEALDSYTELSPSGTGLKVFVEASKPGSRCRTGDIEMYDSARFFTFTGDVFAGGGIEKRQGRLSELYRRQFPQTRNTATPRSYDASTELDDDVLLEKARASSIGREFEALYDRGNPTGGNHSKADNKLMMMLAFWCGKDAEQMERLFSRSALGQRDKWIRRADYRKRTIERACKAVSKPYEPRKPKETTRESLHRCMTYALAGHQWTEKAGRATAAATDYFAYRAMLRTAYKANRMTVKISERELCEVAGLGSRQTARDSLRRLEDNHRLFVKVRKGNKDGAATYRLKTVDSKVDQSLITKNTGIDTSLFNKHCVYIETGTVLSQSPDLRNSAPEMPDYDRNGRRIPIGKQDPVKKLGKVRAWILDMVYAAEGAVSLSFLSERTGVRKNNLKRRYMNQLIVAGLVKRTKEGYMETPNVEEVLKEELEVSGCNDAAKLQQERHDREREAYRLAVQNQPLVDGNIEEPQRVEEEVSDEEAIEDFSDCEMTPLLTPLAIACRDYLERNPSRRNETPSWIANTLWAYDLHPGKPTRHEVAVALGELKGELQAVA
jgi:hypothetical protein